MTQANTRANIVAEFSGKLKSQYPDKFWTKFLFHYTDILNAVSILREGALYPRSAAKEKELLRIDSAGPEVIANTPAHYFDYVRLYFRPRTPPLWHVEGFLPDDGTHPTRCQIPVYFLFSLPTVLCTKGVRWSNGNLASHTSSVFDSAADLSLLNFDDIYHDSFMPNDNPERKAAITKARCAEVIVPKELPLTGSLCYLACRSAAERETFLNLLVKPLRGEYAARTRVMPMCYNRRRPYVERVDLLDKNVTFHYANAHVPSIKRFHYRFEYSGRRKDMVYDQAQSGFNWNRPPGRYTVSLFADDHIAYRGRFEPVAKPL